jgi:hypothetical protein
MVFRGHPATIFWLLTCGAFAAGLSGAVWVLGAILVVVLTIVLHVSARTSGRASRR